MSNSTAVRPVQFAGWASDPGMVRISLEKLYILRPDLEPMPKCCGLSRAHSTQQTREINTIAGILSGGDSRAAVVANQYPLLIAAYTDEIDCIALLNFDDRFVSDYDLVRGSRLLTTNIYFNNLSSYQEDLVPGSSELKRYKGFFPVIADFLTSDNGRLMERKSQISEDEWLRANDLAMDYPNHRPGFARAPLPQGLPKLPRYVKFNMV